MKAEKKFPTEVSAGKFLCDMGRLNFATVIDSIRRNFQENFA
jgi:hypothetical protein